VGTKDIVDVASEDIIRKYIKKFNDERGSNSYSQRDLLKYLITRMDDVDVKLDNHITTNQGRLSIVETTISNLKYMFGVLLVAVLGVFGMVFVMMVA